MVVPYFLTTWDEAISIAKARLGYPENGYISDFDSVVFEAKRIIDKERAEIREKYHEYLKTENWRRLRFYRLTHDNHTCVYCGKKATEVHHLRYGGLGSEEEFDDVRSICSDCHREKHPRWLK